ncbi:MAG: hypothetical protein EXS25_04015 [Pedosphaera sp.]|nr:hypothetical protein [Pedosphaera sp.]
MPWIKKNLAFVISLSVALLLLIAGTVYLFAAQEGADIANGGLEAKKTEYDALVKREPFPNAKNIELAKVEQKRFAELKAKARQTFSKAPRFEALDDASFKSLLSQTIVNLEQEADRKGVKLPAGTGTGLKYSFTFDTQRKELRLAPSTLEPLALALTDISDLSQILFTSRIHSLISIKRSAIGTNETAGSGDLLTKKTTTNSVAGAFVCAYELQFQCFSTELAEVFNHLVTAPSAYVLKMVNIDHSSVEPTEALATPLPMTPAMGMMNMYNRYGARPGMGMGMGMQPPPPPVAAATSGRIGEIVLEQKPLKVTLGLEVVRLNADAVPAGSGASKSPRQQDPKR